MTRSPDATSVCCLILCALLAGCDKATIPAPKDVDAETLCAPYGGVREIGSRTYTVKQRVKETGVTAYCKDGSYVSRSIEVKK